MRITNRLGLPAALVAACQNDPYDPGDSDISITRLIAPPRQVALVKQYNDVLSEDVADRIWALRSQGIHSVLERACDPDPRRAAMVDSIRSVTTLIDTLGGEQISLELTKQGLVDLLTLYPPSPEAANEIAEVRWDTTCFGWKVSGKLDLVSVADRHLWDWKDTSVWSIKRALDPALKGKEVKWEQQANLLRLFGVKYDHTIDHVGAIAFGRDWRKNEKRRYGNDYPDHEVSVVPLKTWPLERARDFLEDRVALHQQAQRGELPECTADERLEQPSIYAAYKIGNVNASKLFGRKPTDGGRPAGDEYVASRKGYELRVRPGESVGCASYCSALSVCTQGQAIVAADAARATKETEE